MDGMPIQSCLPLGGRVSSGTKGEGKPWFKSERCKKNNVMTPARCRPKHLGTRERGAESQTTIKKVRNDRRGQHRVLFRDMRADVPRGPLADCRLAGDVPSPWRKGAQIRGSRVEFEAKKPRLGNLDSNRWHGARGETGDAGGAATPVKATTPGTYCSGVHKQESRRESSCAEDM